jgi:hypothetical protein
MRVVASPGGRGILGGEMRGRARVYLGMRYGGGEGADASSDHLLKK